MAKPRPKKITVLGNGLNMVKGPSDEAIFTPTKDTIYAADAAGRYYQPHAGHIELIACLGGWPALAKAGEIEQPPPDKVESAWQIRQLIRIWRVPASILGGEGLSISTYGNLIEGVRAGLLVPGEFTPDNPFVVSTRRVHALRTGIIATQALALPPGSLYRLADARSVSSSAWQHEALLSRITLQAQIDISPEPGNIEDTERLLERFGELWEDRDSIAEIPLPAAPPTLSI